MSVTHALAFMCAVIMLAIPFGVLYLIATWPERDEPRHTLDCLDWRRHGQRDITCTAHHGTDWFEPRAQVEFENAFDSQIGVHRG